MSPSMHSKSPTEQFHHKKAFFSSANNLVWQWWPSRHEVYWSCEWQHHCSAPVTHVVLRFEDVCTSLYEVSPELAPCCGFYYCQWSGTCNRIDKRRLYHDGPITKIKTFIIDFLKEIFKFKHFAYYLSHRNFQWRQPDQLLEFLIVSVIIFKLV